MARMGGGEPQTGQESQRFSTKELSTKTWLDFERLFRKPGEWDPCWCMYYHRDRPLPKSMWLHSRARRAARNRREHGNLVKLGCAHGILVYARGEPVGWCQYGPKEELPRIDAKRNYRGLYPSTDDKRLWRITCFVVDRKYRKRGIASIALKAALGSIRRRGGGLIEAYPITHWGALANWFGTVSMFEEEGFKKVAPFGRSAVLMRKSI